MTGKAEEFFLKTRKVPFGIICGACGIAVFFATLGLVIGYAVTAGIAAQTGKTVSFLENWWQVVLFIVLILAAMVAIAALVLYVIRRMMLIAGSDDKYYEDVDEADATAKDRINAFGGADAVITELDARAAKIAELEAALADATAQNAALQAELSAAKAHKADLETAIVAVRDTQQRRKKA